jgi:3-deoxy-7-phosphoheptulonate synthase
MLIMIVVVKPQTPVEKVQEIVTQVESFGLKAHLIVGTERTVIALVGDERKCDEESLRSFPEVESVMRVLAPYKVASLETKKEPTVVKVLDMIVGGGNIGIMAGPCSVESEEHILEAAKLVKAAGATCLRGGAYKPRTSPYSFQGHKEDGLKMLANARAATGLAIVTEVMSPQHVEQVAKYADILQIGARNMQNYHLLQECGEIRKPILLKRGPSATIEEFLLAAEYILSAGNHQVILCERGIRTFEAHTRFTLPLATVGYLKQKTHLPVVIDPSHGTGIAALVPSMCLASVACGADGLIIEVHQDPPHAMSDGAQSITPKVFTETMQQCQKVATALGYKLS